MLTAGVLSYFLSAVFIYMGFHKMFVYENPESFLEESVNAYVGGDAYNYIINGNYATGFFVLSLLFVVLGSFLIYFDYIRKRDKAALNTKTSEVVKSENVNPEIV